MDTTTKDPIDELIEQKKAELKVREQEALTGFNRLRDAWFRESLSRLMPKASDEAKREAESAAFEAVRTGKHTKDPSFRAIVKALEKAIADATLVKMEPFDQWVAGAQLEIDQLRAQQQAGAVLDHPDPLGLVEEAIRDGGYGGDLRPPKLVYLAATTRLLDKSEMLAHTFLRAQASVGKSHAVNTVRTLLPDDAVIKYDGGSPRAIIYDPRSFEHRILYIGEIDGIPRGEENGATVTAIRTLLQENRFEYPTVIKDPKTNQFTTVTMNREGPTVLITTGTRAIGDGEQLMSRFYIVDLPDDHAQLEASLLAQADTEINGRKPANGELIGFQAYLQTMTPWRVVVPFVMALAQHVAKASDAPRINRDLSRLLSLIKAVAILRHRQRRVGEDGRLIAEVADYEYVYNLVRHVYETSVTGVTPNERTVVETVARLRDERYSGEVSAAQVYKAIPRRMSKRSVERAIAAALRSGHLTDRNEADNVKRKRPVYDLAVGEPLPIGEALPEPALLLMTDEERDRREVEAAEEAIEALYREGIDEDDTDAGQAFAWNAA